MSGTARVINIDWEPQPRQLTCLRACGLSLPFDDIPLSPAIADVIGYGGSAGGGKTDTLLQIAIIAALHYPKIQIAYFRREFPQLDGLGGAINRSRELISHFAKYNQQKHEWKFPNGSILQFNHCANPTDVYNYQSQQFDILLIDEVTQFTGEMVKYLLTRNRKTIDVDTFIPFAAFGTNPGNVGHQYFKDEFVTIGSPELVHTFINEVGNPERHIFIPSRLNDNQILVDRDPGYENRVGNTELNRKVLLEGSWDVFMGQAFSELLRTKHIINDFPIPAEYRLFGAYDQGFNHPFSFGIFAVDREGSVYLVARATDRLKRIDEIARIMEETAKPFGGLSKLSYIVAGWDCWTRQRDGGPSIQEQFMKSTPKILLTKAKEDRVQAVNQIRKFVAWRGAVLKEGKLVDGEPKFFIFKSCQNVFDVLSRMIFDTEGPKPEDVLKVDADENGKGGDDDYDMVRYGLMSRPRPGEQVKPTPPQNSILGYIQKKEQDRELRRQYVGH